MKIRNVIYSANTGLDAIKRAPVLEYPTDLRCIRIQDISQGKPFSEWAYTKTTDNDYKKFKLCKNDVLVARTGATVGVSYLVKGDIESVFNNGSIRLRVNEKANAKFLYYLINTKEFLTFIDNVSCVATQPNLRIENLLRFDFPDFSMEKQTEIADILSSYDDLIENNNKRIKILEQMAENLYKEWFVRFRFPNYENAEFENGIPKGWKSCKLRDIASEVGKSINSDKRDAYNYYLPIDSIPNKSMGLTEVNDIENAESSLHTFKKGDILFGSMRPYFHKVLLAPFDGITRKTCFVINAKNKKYSDWLYLLMYQQSTVAFATTVCVGSTMPYVRQQDLFRMNIILPDENIVQAFSKKVSPILNRISLFFFENQNLIKQRDMLLPRLMSGKLEIKQPQEKVVAFKPKLTFEEFKNGFAAAARKDSGLTEQDMEELYKAYCDDSRDE